ncbi:unnamed protein product [Prunus armeniaca]
MDDDGDIDIFFSNWNNKNRTDRLFIVSCLIAALIGILTIAYMWIAIVACPMKQESEQQVQAYAMNKNFTSIAVAILFKCNIRSQSDKSKHGNEPSVDTGNSGSTGGMSTESTADTHQAVNLSSVDFNGVW